MNNILLSLIILIFSGFPAWADVSVTIPSSDAAVYEILAQSFPGVPKEKFIVKSLKGGLSGTALYKIEFQDKQYVLRLHRSEKLSPQDEREHFALIKAAKMGIAPRILYVAEDNKAILMEFIEGKTLSIEQANLPENCIKLANAIRQAHQISGHPHAGESLLSKAQRCYKKVLNDGLGSQDEIKGAFELVEKYSQELSLYKYEKVNVHGDLNPRNIFLTANGVLLIDWAESTLEDPFYDLTYFAQKLDYSPENEFLLLNTYLQRSPTLEEFNRYSLQKKIHQAFWSLTNLYLADAELKKNPRQQINPKASLKNWGFYQKEYADSLELPAQYFYELSRLNYQIALDAQS